MSHSEKPVHQEQSAFAIGPSCSSETSFFKLDTDHNPTWSSVHWTVVHEGEKMRIPTPHLESSNFWTRTTTPVIAYVIGLPD
jgi:hypothetical protein